MKTIQTRIRSLKKKAAPNDSISKSKSDITAFQTDYITETLPQKPLKNENTACNHTKEERKDEFDIALEQNKLALAYLLKDNFPDNLTVQMLKDKGIEKEFLLSAIKTGNVEFVNYLITYQNADIYSVFDKNLNAFKIAKENEDIEMMGYIKYNFPNYSWDY